MERRIPWAIALIGSTMTAGQLVLMRLLAYIHGHHFAWLIISLALLGIGASGSVLFILRTTVTRHEARILPLTLCGGSLILAATPWVLNHSFLRFRHELLPLEVTPWIILGGLGLLLAIPFFAAGLVVGHLLTSRARQAHRLYAADLAGAGLGGIIGILMAAHLFPETATAFVAGVLLLSAGLLTTRDQLRCLLPAMLAAALAAGAGTICPVMLQPSEERPLAAVLRLPETSRHVRLPDAQGIFETVESPYLRDLPGLSLVAPGTPPVRPVAFLDASPLGPLATTPAASGKGILTFTTESLGFVTRPVDSVLHLGSEGGQPAELALMEDVREIRISEPVSALRRILAGRLRSAMDTGRISLTGTGPRATLATTPRSWDLIRFPTMGTPGGESGFSALGEDYLYTVDGFRSAWNLLTDHGAIQVTVWPDYPPRNLGRLIATMRAALESAGVAQPRTHFAAWRNWGAATLLLHRQPVTESMAAIVRRRAEALQFDLLLLPGLRPGERQRFHRIDDPEFFETVDAAIDRSDADPSAARVFSSRPPTDDRPFFHQHINPAFLPRLVAAVGLERVYHLEPGTFLTIAATAMLGGAALVLIAFPLLLPAAGSHARPPPWSFLCFASLGFGYLAVEIVLIQKLHLILGNPVYSAALVLASLLVLSGLGSACSRRLARSRPWLPAAAVACLLPGVALLLNTGVGGTPWIKPGIGGAIAALVLIAPLAVAMGMPFPTALRVLENENPAALPWAWAVNGCFSVITPPLAVLAAVTVGFTSVLLFAAGVYLLAAWAVGMNRRRSFAGDSPQGDGTGLQPSNATTTRRSS